MTLREAVEAEYLPEKRKRRRITTVAGYESALRLHVLPRFGDLEVEQIDHDDIQEWVDGFSRPGAAEKAYKTLRQVIRWVIRKHRLRIWDPTQGIELPRKPAYRPQTLQPSEVRETLRGFWGHDLEPVVVLSSVLGLRPGEAYAMRWDRVDMRSGAVRVSETLQQVGSAVVAYPPKTAKSDRVCYLPRFALDRLRAVWRSQGKPKGRLCPDSPQRAARRIKRHCRRQGLPYVTMRNRRHTWATIAVEAGASIEAVAMMLGHSSILTAYEHYIVPKRSICQGVQRLWQQEVMTG